MSQQTEAPAALVAFLKGAERRAYVFLWLQSGDAGHAEHALPAAFRAFRAQAGRLPLAEWPVAFWRLLAMLPDADSGRWAPELAALAGVDARPRRALLLRLAGGLQEDQAAEVLSIALPAYEQALAEACPRDAAGRPDVEAWRRLAEAVQQVVRDLAPTRLAELAVLREQALAAPVERGEGADGREGTGVAGHRRVARRRWPWVLLVLLLCAAALLATWPRSWPWPWLAGGIGADTPQATADPDDLRVHDAGPITVEPLPAEAGPAPEPMLPAAMAEPPSDPVIARMDLLSWYAAGAPASRLERETAPADAPLPAMPIMDASTEGLEAAWAGLDAAEQARLRAAATAFDALDAARQLELRTAFATLDRMERAGWRLGPSIGADYPALQPLLGQVPADERDALLGVLRQLDPEERAQLAVLSARTPGHERDGLRRELLAQAPEQRSAWLARRLR